MKQHDSTGMANGAKADCHEEAPAAEEHITLSQAAKLAPGRPSSNCVWRWCREGVKAASGTRVRLKHVRFGSRIYTTRQWLNDFGVALAEGRRRPLRPGRAVARHRARALTPAVQRVGPGVPAPTGADEGRRRHLEAERELEQAGL